MRKRLTKRKRLTAADESMDTKKAGINHKKIESNILADYKTAASKYGWIITYGNPGIGLSRDRGKIGPRSVSKEMEAQLKAGEGEKFEMYDDDKELYYKGRIVGKYSGFEPLDDFGEPNAGAVHIKVNGRWV